MNDYNTRINEVIHNFDLKKNKKLKTDLFLRLCKKVGEEDADISSMISDTLLLLVELSNNEDIKKKSYIKSFNVLKKTVRKKLDYTPKGLLLEENTGMGVALGTAFGAIFFSMNSAYLAIGIPIGLAIGAMMGRNKESDAEKAEKTY